VVMLASLVALVVSIILAVVRALAAPRAEQ
jgi:hypothetical protein